MRYSPPNKFIMLKNVQLLVTDSRVGKRLMAYIHIDVAYLSFHLVEEHVFPKNVLCTDGNEQILSDHFQDLNLNFKLYLNLKCGF